jgi:hypothetical protein
MKEACEAMTRLRQVDPSLRVSDLKVLTPFRRPEDITRYEEASEKLACRTNERSTGHGRGMHATGQTRLGTMGVS